MNPARRNWRRATGRCSRRTCRRRVLGGREVWLAYRCRWQIELLFKRAKGMAGWSFSHGHSGDRVLAELLAKVLGLIVLHWASLLVEPAHVRAKARRG